MADYENETLEETQRRLASQSGGAASPWVNRPSTATPVTPSAAPSAPAPYVAPADAAPHVEPRHAPAYTQPDPLSGRTTSGRARGILIAGIIAGTVTVLGIAIAVALAFSSIVPGAPGGPIDAIWVDYPGNAYAEPAEVLASDSKEVVVADAEAFLAAFRDELTAELGLEWTEAWEGSLEYGSNYYEGESLLWDYNSGEWQGSVAAADPAARAKMAEIFERVSAQFGAPEYRFNNDIYSDDAEQSEEQFGAAALTDQAVWSVTASGGESRRQLRIAGRAWDRSLATSSTFTGNVWFDEEVAGSDRFVVTVSLWSYDLLAETDRAEYIERLKPYEGLERPEPN